MKRNGFTLIELLAVIVILTIIALIATPIILGIINDARKESQERSVELYASAIRNGIAAYQLREMKEVAVGSYTSETLPFDVEYDGNVVCTTIDIYDNGGVYVAGCEVNDVEVEYTYGTKQVAKGTIGICNPISVATEGIYTAGDKYECDVDPNKEGYDYTFYVLTSALEGATSVNLIMDSNINISGNAVKGEETDLGLVAWHADSGSNRLGPITAMDYLQTATAGWSNVNSQTINTFIDDEGNTHPMTEYVVNARMPYLSEVSEYSASANNEYLYDNLQLVCWNEDWSEEIACSDALDENKFGIDVEGIEHKKGVEQYWTFTSNGYDIGTASAYVVNYKGIFDEYSIQHIKLNPSGVRPVINLSI